jgi:hypothetical protein
MLTIGALNFDYGDKVVAGFSNLGKWMLMFCTWRKIYATTPNDTFKYLQGTSMASQMLLELLL